MSHEHAAGLARDLGSSRRSSDIGRRMHCGGKPERCVESSRVGSAQAYSGYP